MQTGLDHPLLCVLRDCKVSMAQQDWTSVPEQEFKSRVEAFLHEDRAVAFDLAVPPLFRLTWITLPRARALLVLSYHPVVADTDSVATLLKEAGQTYEGLARRKPETLPPAPQFQDYVKWLGQQDRAERRRPWLALVGTKAFWIIPTGRHFKGALPVCPTISPPSVGVGHHGRENAGCPRLPGHRGQVCAVLGRGPHGQRHGSPS